MSEELLERARRGDKEAEREIFQYLRVRFGHLAGLRIRDREAAEDVAQQACLTVLEKYKGEVFTVGFEAWAHGVLKMHIRSRMHRMQVDEERVSRQGGGVDELGALTGVDPLIERRLLKCLRKIIPVNRRYARVLNLSFQGYKADEICEKLGISRNNLYVMLNRARSVLWFCLSQEKEMERGKL